MLATFSLMQNASRGSVCLVEHMNRAAVQTAARRVFVFAGVRRGLDPAIKPAANDHGYRSSGPRSALTRPSIPAPAADSPSPFGLRTHGSVLHPAQDRGKPGRHMSGCAPVHDAYWEP